MSFNKTKWVWHNGGQVLWDEAKVHATAYGLHYGAGVFEGIRAYETESGPAVFRLAEHLDRMYKSADIYNLNIPYTRDELTEAITENIRLNDLKDCYIRPIVYFDSGSLGIRAVTPVSTTIIAWKWEHALHPDKKKHGLRTTISPWRKIHHSMMPSTAKSTGQYLSSVHAVQDAVKRGFDEAIFLNAEGNIAEGAVENLFIVKNNRVITNDEQSSVLLGITRSSVIDIARDLGYHVDIRTITPDELFKADEAFFTGTAVEIAAIGSVDDRPIGSGTSGPVTSEIKDKFTKIIHGKDDHYAKWLHYEMTTV